MINTSTKLLLSFLLISASSFSQTLQWANKTGGSTGDIGSSVAVDSYNNVYTGGFFSGTVDLDPGTGTQTVTAVGGNDAVIQKFNSSGALIYAYSFGSLNADNVGDFVIDENDNIYITINFSNVVDFDPGTGTSSHTSNGGSDAAVLKFDSAGNLLWSISYGGILDDGARAITIDTNGTTDHIIITGTFRGTVDFDPGAGSSVITSNGAADGYILKLDENGNFVWSYAIGGSSDEEPTGIGVDAAGNVYLGGNFSTTVDFDYGTGSNILTSAGGRDIFFMKLDSSSAFSWAFRIGSTGLDKSLDLVVDSAGNTFGAGFFFGTADFNPGTGTNNLTSAGNADIFVMQITPAGAYSWAKRIGSTGADKVNAIAMDADGNLYPGGFFTGTVDFDPGSGTHNLVSNGNVDIFYQKLTSSGDFEWAYGTGSSAADKVNGMAIGADNFVHATGYFQSTVDFDPTTSTTNLSSAGSYDIFRLRLDPCIISTSTISDSFCGSYTSPSGNYTWTTPGTYMDTLTNTGGCDSILTINLAYANTFDTISLISCYGVTSPSGNYFWTIPGTYPDTIPNNAGCDSILTCNVINGVSYAQFDTTVCSSYTSPSGNYTWTTTGTYFDTIPNSTNCDSVLIINLTIATSQATINPTACNSYTSPSGSNIWTSSGTYYDTLTNILGCDSILTINLTISGNSSSATLNETSCGVYTSPSGNYTWNTSGTYQDTIPNNSGCDSLLTIVLTVVEIDTTISVNGFTLTSNESGASYQWFDCNTIDFPPVSGAVNQSFTPTVSSYYAVKITKNTCVDTSDCTPLFNVGFQELSGTDIQIYPNPVQDILNITTHQDIKSVVVYNLSGQVVLTPTLNTNYIDVSKLNTGIYFIEIEISEGKTQMRFVKE